MSICETVAVPSLPVDHASREWATDPYSDAWWRARGQEFRVLTGIKEPRVPISTAHTNEPIMFQRQYKHNEFEG